MVGKTIKSGGIAITGQERLEYDNGYHVKKKRIGLKGELTLLQLYKAALSQGKAYSDHKHHHAQQSKNDETGEDGENSAGITQSTVTLDSFPHERTTEHIFFENGQLKPLIPVSELLAKNIITPEHNQQILTFENLRDSAGLFNVEVSSPKKNNARNLFNKNAEAFAFFRCTVAF